VTAGEGPLGDLAAAILDGTPIDWTSVEARIGGDAQLLLGELRSIASLADLHRSSLLPAPSATAVRSGAARERRLQQWAHLRVLEPIGRGAFGEVYRAWDTRLDREVALKLLPATSAGDDPRDASVIHEGRLLARVRHPNVVTIYGAAQIGDQIGLWMEFVKGQTLEQMLERGHVFSPAEVIDIGIELSHAVGAVHDAGLLHRDIKTRNVILADDGRVVLMDFGTGRELSEAATAGVAGTPLYLSPELLAGAPASVRSDVYGLGVVLYHLLTRSYPINAAGLRDLRLAHQRRERTALIATRPDVPPRLARAIERAIDPQPDQRPASARELTADLIALKPGTRRKPLTYVLASAAALILIVLVGWEMRGRRLGDATRMPVIAVLPLTNLSAAQESDYFVDGLTDEIIRNLAVIDGMEVRSRTSSFTFKDKPHTPKDVGDQLGANLVLDGSVLRAGPKLRVNVQLVQVAGDVPLWSGRFDRELDDVFAIQDEISLAIVNQLRLTLGRGRRRYNTNLDAYELYLKARALVERRGPDSAKQAAQLFEQVIAKDSSFAPAYAGLADAYAFMSTLPAQGLGAGLSGDDAYPIIRSAASKALQLDPLLAEAYAAMGVVYSRERNWEKSEEAFRRAIELNPSLSQIYTTYAFSTLRPTEKFAEAEQMLERAMRMDPMSLDVQREMAVLLLNTGRYGKAVDILRHVYAVDPRFPFASLHLARALTFAGRPAEAITLYEEMEKQSGVPSPWSAHAYVRVGRREEAEALAVRHAANPYRLAIIYAALDQKDRAFDALDRMTLVESQRVGLLLGWPEMAGLRGDPRFAEIRRKYGLR